jgi:hypothetical protein
MEAKHINIRKKIFTGLVALASFWSIATAKFEREQQNCGMFISQLKKKNSPFKEEAE